MDSDLEYCRVVCENPHLKRCPQCGVITDRSNGCNYIKCSISNCQCEWCFVCGLHKYIANGCSDKSHNSH